MTWQILIAPNITIESINIRIDLTEENPPNVARGRVTKEGKEEEKNRDKKVANQRGPKTEKKIHGGPR